MKQQSTKKYYASLSGRQAFIMTVLMFSIITGNVNAQNCNPQHPCPPGYICNNGHCKAPTGGGPCSCNMRPIPPRCAAMCGFLAGKNETDNGTFLASVVSNSVSKSNTISFSLQQPEKVSIRIFEITGRLVETLTDGMFEKGEHELKWDEADADKGIYLLQFDAGTYSEIKKISVVR